MPPKSGKTTIAKSTTDKSSTYGESDETYAVSKRVSLNLGLKGEVPGPGEWIFLIVFNGQIVLDTKWQNGVVLDTVLPVNLKDPYFQLLVTDKPLIFLLRILGAKGSRDPDPLLNIDNRAGATVDLFPLLIGEEEIFIKVPLIFINSGLPTNCRVKLQVLAGAPSDYDDTTVPLVMTMISAHCLPLARDGTVYIGAVGLDGVHERVAVNFGTSLSLASAVKTVWATASNCGFAANTAHNVPNDDKFIPEDVDPADKEDCRSFYWNAMKRVRVDPNLLRERLNSPLLVEIAGIPKTGKIEIRGRYMGFVDAKVLLEPGQYGVTVCTRLFFYNEQNLPENMVPLLELPPSSAKASARTETDLVFDEFRHNAYIVLRFDLCEPLVSKLKISGLYESIGLIPPDGPASPIDELYVDPPPEDPAIDVRKIRKESGALAVHKELSGLACRGAVPMNQGIKRTAANRLLMRVRSMLKQFSPGDCSVIDFQDIVMAQHAACRRAVTSSFAPQPPSSRGGKILDSTISTSNFKSSVGNPRVLICKALRCLEEHHEIDARSYIFEGLNAQPRNRFLIWAFGAQEFDKGEEANEMAAAAFRISVKGDYSDGIATTIGWAALHSLEHFNGNPYGAFAAAKKMRKCYELPREWKKFIQRWKDASGEEEVYWFPDVVTLSNPLLIAAAFFICLRCFKFSEMLLHCLEEGCATKGSRFKIKTEIMVDISYVRAASLVVQHKLDEALEVTTQAIKSFGPNPMMCQMRAACLICARGWDGECAIALQNAEKAGCEPCPALLLVAALGELNTNPKSALQRAALAHKIFPCGNSALAIGRIYAKMDEAGLAERWAAVAVKFEPMLADGWAVLALLALYEQKLDKSRAMLRTAKQVGTISPEIEEEIKRVMEVVQGESLPESLVKNLRLDDD